MKNDLPPLLQHPTAAMGSRARRGFPRGAGGPRGRSGAFFALVWGLMPGCVHYQVELPGVLDLRSDGRSASPDSRTPARSVTGESAWLTLDSVTRDGAALRIQHRHGWFGLTLLAPGVVPVSHTDVGSVVRRGFEQGAVYRAVRLRHALEPGDVLVELAARCTLMMLCPWANVLAPIGPIMTLTLDAERVAMSTARSVPGSGEAGPAEPPPAWLPPRGGPPPAPAGEQPPPPAAAVADEEELPPPPPLLTPADGTLGGASPAPDANLDPVPDDNEAFRLTEEDEK